MQFSSEEYAKECLSHISYFRLKYYWTDMRDEETEHDFKEGASFDDVIARYNFDRSLRLILFDAIEIIEVALRAKIINHLSQAKGSGLWYLDSSLFERKDYYEDFVLDLKHEFNRSTEPFAKEHHQGDGSTGKATSRDREIGAGTIDDTLTKASRQASVACREAFSNRNVQSQVGRHVSPSTAWMLRIRPSYLARFTAEPRNSC